MYRSIMVFFSFFMVMSISACKDNTVVPSKKKEVVSQMVPVLPESELRILAFNCTNIDYTFKELPISLSFNKDQGLETNLFFASGILPTYETKNCKPLARKIYSVGTEIYLEAEVYFDGKCHHYDFYKNGKLTYRSDMTEQGIFFYNNIVKQAQQAQSGQPMYTQ